MKAIVNLVKAAVKKVRKSFTKEETITEEVKTNDFKTNENSIPADEVKETNKAKISEFHKNLMESGYTLGQAKEFGKIIHIWRNTKSHRIRWKNINKLFELQREVYKK